jgi:hypothetical protein
VEASVCPYSLLSDISWQFYFCIHYTELQRDDQCAASSIRHSVDSTAS